MSRDQNRHGRLAGALAPERTPETYGGFFLDRADPVTDRGHGAFCFPANTQPEGWRVVFERGHADDALW